VSPSFAQSERRALCDLFLEVGPDAATLCQGWQAADLAAHLVLRERRPGAAAGILIGPLRTYTARTQQSIRDGHPWPELVAMVRSGPPPLLRPLDEPVNTVEYFLHHEDVRRAQTGCGPRDLDRALEVALWRRLRGLALLARRRVPGGLTLTAPGHGTLTVRAGEPAVGLTAAPSELLLFITGRQQAAVVQADGPPDAVRRLQEVRLGL
jgi:uncharacterized protein (TIGR03085 family)